MALIGATLMAVLIVFQAALALGAPWGRATWGGQHPGTLPRHLRMASAANILVFGFAILIFILFVGLFFSVPTRFFIIRFTIFFSIIINLFCYTIQVVITCSNITIHPTI